MGAGKGKAQRAQAKGVTEWETKPHTPLCYESDTKWTEPWRNFLSEQALLRTGIADYYGIIRSNFPAGQAGDRLFQASVAQELFTDLVETNSMDFGVASFPPDKELTDIRFVVEEHISSHNDVLFMETPNASTGDKRVLVPPTLATPT